MKRDTDEEFVTHAALVEHLRQFRQEGVVFFHPPSGEASDHAERAAQRGGDADRDQAHQQRRASAVD